MRRTWAVCRDRWGVAIVQIGEECFELVVLEQVAMRVRPVAVLGAEIRQRQLDAGQRVDARPVHLLEVHSIALKNVPQFLRNRGWSQCSDHATI